MEKNFVQGIRAYRPREGAPEYIKLNLVINREALLMWLEAQEVDEKGQLRADLKESKSGKLYLEVNTYGLKPSKKPKTASEREFDALDEVIPQNEPEPSDKPVYPTPEKEGIDLDNPTF